MKQLVSHRLDSELLAWATSYAKSRGTSRAVVIEDALESARRGSESGVPDLSVGSPSVRRARSGAAESAPVPSLLGLRQRALNDAKSRASR